MDFAINGFGRIGRALFRIAFYDGRNICTHINEPNASIDDIIYFLKYDSLYANFNARFSKITDNIFSVEDADKKWMVSLSCCFNPAEIKTNSPIIVDASNVGKYYKRDDKILIFTFSNAEIHNEVILGLNNFNFQKVKMGEAISGSICDSVAIAPILGKLMEKHAILQILITTMHPALTYQKVLDNYPAEEINRSLGRQYNSSIIPKRTSLETVLKRHLNTENTLIRCMSFRIPTELVCSADLTLFFKDTISYEDILNELKDIDPKIITFSNDDLVSIDYRATSVSATIDMRWLDVLEGHILKMVVWYDNEWGYSSRINDIIARF